MKKGGRSQKAPAHFEPSQAVKMPTNMYTRKMLRQKRRECARELDKRFPIGGSSTKS